MSASSVIVSIILWMMVVFAVAVGIYYLIEKFEVYDKFVSGGSGNTELDITPTISAVSNSSAPVVTSALKSTVGTLDTYYATVQLTPTNETDLASFNIQFAGSFTEVQGIDVIGSYVLDTIVGTIPSPTITTNASNGTASVSFQPQAAGAVHTINVTVIVQN